MTIDMSVSGLLRFSRYAFPPNRLGYCGGDDHAGLYQYMAEKRADGGLRDLAKNFEGAYPYLQLISQATNISDPLDARVVEAYWLGNEWLDQVTPIAFYRFLERYYKKIMTPERFAIVKEALSAGAKPHHNFHVFGIFLFLQKGFGISLQRKERVVGAVDGCRISWGRVMAVMGNQLVVERPPVVIHEDHWMLGKPVAVRVDWKLEEDGRITPVKPGEMVSMHWGWASERLDARQVMRLMRDTQQFIALANQRFAVE